MPRIEFHFNAPALVPYGCRLLRKITAQGFRVQVVGEPVTLALLDEALWTFSPVDFIAHAPVGQSGAEFDRARVWLLPEPKPATDATVLVNLGPQVPEGIEGFERVIEVVTVDELHRAQGRQRWKQYTDGGHTLVRHDLGKLTV